jgi:hypothetical protein
LSVGEVHVGGAVPPLVPEPPPPDPFEKEPMLASPKDSPYMMVGKPPSAERTDCCGRLMPDPTAACLDRQ